MNHLLRPRIWPSFLASSDVGSCDVPFRVRLGSNTLRLPGGTPIFTVSQQQFMKHPGLRPVSLKQIPLDMDQLYLVDYFCKGT
jgi:hypothetical protein